MQNRNERVQCGPVFCEQCGKFFDDKKQNIANYATCKAHKKKQGYSLFDRIGDDDAKLV